MYSNVLRNMIADANITQEEISKKCKELGTPISRVQINKILNNKAPAPEEVISRSIAKICNVDDRELVLEGYLEKAPKEFIEFLNKLQNMLAEIGLYYLGYMLSEEQKNIVKEKYKRETLAQTILEILHSNDIIKIDSNSMKYEDIENQIKIIINDFSCINMEDDSMEPRIPIGSKLRIQAQEKYKNGDIVLIKVGEKILVRTIFLFGRDICIYALNSNYSSQYLKGGEYEIIAKITSIEVFI